MNTNDEKLIDRGDYYEIENCEVKEVICEDGTPAYCYCPFIPKILTDLKSD